MSYAFTDVRTLPTSPSAPRARRTQADRSAATRDALVAAARRLFAEQGFAEVSTDAIVAAAGVTRGALYHQFADKTALFDAVLDAVEADIARRLAEDVAAAGITDPVDAMRHVLRTWLEICVEPEIHRIALIDGPSVLGWAHWREVCQRHVFGLARGHARAGHRVGAHPPAAGPGRSRTCSWAPATRPPSTSPKQQTRRRRAPRCSRSSTSSSTA